MIRYPADIKAEILAATKEYLEKADEAYDDLPDKERERLVNAYVYAHVSDKAKAFLSTVDAICEGAERQGIKAL